MVYIWDKTGLFIINIPVADVRSISYLKTAKARTSGVDVYSIPMLKPYVVDIQSKRPFNPCSNPLYQSSDVANVRQAISSQNLDNFDLN